MSTAPLLLVAASGLAREVLAAVRVRGTHEVVGLLDDNEDLHGSSVGGVRVLGGIESVADHPDALLVVCAGKGSSRAALVERLGASPERFATVLHPTVEVPGGCTVGPGSVLLSGVVLTADVTVGSHVVAMPQVTFTHDDVIEDFATFAAGVSLGGSVRVGRGAYLGMNVSVREGLSVGAGATVGMGAAVLASVPGGQTWAGVPARALRSTRDADGVPVGPGGGYGSIDTSRATAGAAGRTDES
ncbi:NeuD/PglB/VioB family sugar acetyltransferase [Actinotalea sp.]|uniref:NeuD/PglB/VioB family sugar acetyltransferase n=1 Tax=Actinotalea sp. TaxID=1872145 RepID=UPI00356708D1